MTNPKTYLYEDPETGRAKLKMVDIPKKPREENPAKELAAAGKRERRRWRNLRLSHLGGFKR